MQTLSFPRSKRAHVACSKQIQVPWDPLCYFGSSLPKKVCQKSICNCFHSCVSIMGSLIILHVIYETVLVIFRRGLSVLTSVLQRCIHKGPDAPWAPPGQTLVQVTSLEMQTLHRAITMDQGPKALLPELSEVKRARAEQAGMLGELLSACKIRRKWVVLILWIKFLDVTSMVHPYCILYKYIYHHRHGIYHSMICLSADIEILAPAEGVIHGFL